MVCYSEDKTIWRRELGKQFRHLLSSRLLMGGNFVALKIVKIRFVCCYFCMRSSVYFFFFCLSGQISSILSALFVSFRWMSVVWCCVPLICLATNPIIPKAPFSRHHGALDLLSPQYTPDEGRAKRCWMFETPAIHLTSLHARICFPLWKRAFFR